MKNLIAFLPLLFLYGCASPSYQLNDVRVNALVVADVLTAKCQSIYPNVSTYTEYRKAASKLLSVADLNSALYSDGYRKVTQVTNAKTNAQMQADCEEYVPKIAAMIPEMREDYDAYVYLADADRKRQARAWANAIELFATAANQISQTAQSYNYPFIPIPSGKVTFGPTSGGGYNHYLINTPGGTKQCHVSSSGYIFCN